MRHLIVIGACYIDTILTVPHYPAEDHKLRSQELVRRRGGNGPNSIEVLQQLLNMDAIKHSSTLKLSLCSVLPSYASSAVNFIKQSLDHIDLSLCIYREDSTEAASSYIIRSKETASRTIVNYNELPEMTSHEFHQVVEMVGNIDGHRDSTTWFHFEGRIPDVTMKCFKLVRERLPRAYISVEIEKPGRHGLQELASEADVVFYSKSWALHAGYHNAAQCLRDQQEKTINPAFLICTWGDGGASLLKRESGDLEYQPAYAQDLEPVDTIGAGDTFIAGMLFMLQQRPSWPLSKQLAFANRLAGLKVTREGFARLGEDIAAVMTE